MAEPLFKGPFDIPDVRRFIPRPLRPWIFIVFVVIIQFSGALYLGAVSDMVGDKALMTEDIMMAGYASLIGMSLNFAVMFRMKFRFSNSITLLGCCAVLIAANILTPLTDNTALLVVISLIAGWFRMQATFACNSTIQLWLTPVRDMSVFFCYVYLVVDGIIQLSGIATAYASFAGQWQWMNLIMTGLLAAMMILVLVLLRPFKGPMRIPLLGIDWLGSVLWGVFMLAFTFICVYGHHYDWWEGEEIVAATVIGAAALLLNLWRATFLRHPYISFAALTNRNVVNATIVYLVFFTLIATEHVIESNYAMSILGFDSTNLADLNWAVFAGIIAGVALTYFTFARRRWRYLTMTAIGFIFAAAYLAWFYFFLDYGVEKEALYAPLFCRGVASVVISIVFLTSIVQSGLPFMVFPQALTVNGFTGAVVGATFGPAIVGELLSRLVAKNSALLGTRLTDVFVSTLPRESLGDIMSQTMRQALAVSMKEIYGWMLIGCLAFIVVIAVSYSPLRPKAIFPSWATIRRILRRSARVESCGN